MNEINRGRKNERRNEINKERRGKKKSEKGIKMKERLEDKRREAKAI